MVAEPDLNENEIQNSPETKNKKMNFFKRIKHNIDAETEEEMGPEFVPAEEGDQPPPPKYLLDMIGETVW